MDSIGLSETEKADFFRVVAAVLHLSNVHFEENTKDKKGGSYSPFYTPPFARCASLTYLKAGIIFGY